MNMILFHVAIVCLYVAPQPDFILEEAYLVGHTDGIQEVSFSPDGTLLASGSRDNSIRLWDVREGGVIKILEERESWPMAVRFSPDGRVLAGAYSDGAIHLWDIATRKLTRQIDGHMDPTANTDFLVYNIAFSPDGRTLASASIDKTVRVWDVATGRLHYIVKHNDLVRDVVFSHDGTLLASIGFERTVRVLGVASGEQMFAFDKGGEGAVGRILAFSPDDRLLACAGFGSDIRLWDLKSGGRLAVLKTHTDLVRSLRFFPTRNLLLSAGRDETLKLWNLETLSEVASLPLGSTSDSQCVALASDGHIVSALENGDVVLRSSIAPLYKEEARIRLDHGKIDALDVARKQALLAVGSRDGTVTLVRWKPVPPRASAKASGSN